MQSKANKKQADRSAAGQKAAKGLTAAEVEKRRQQYGDNRAQGNREDTLLFRLRRAFFNPFSVVLLVLALISCLVDVVLLPKAERNYTTVLIISLMLLFSGCVRLTQELKAKKITDRLVRLVDAAVSVKRDGSWEKCAASELVVGDFVRVTAGERVPADLLPLRTNACFVSESAITGESALLEKEAAEMPENGRKPDEKQLVFCGTTVVSGSFEGVVTAVGKQTRYGGISPGVSGRKRGYDQGSNSIARVLIRFMVLLVPLVFVASGLTKGNWVSAFLFALSVAVGLTPELLPMVITACLAKGSFSMGQKQTVVKNVNAMQGFGSMDVLCIDKTGTLTQNTLLLEYVMDLLGNEDQRVLDCAYLNSFYHSGVCNHLDAAVLQAGEVPQKKAHYEALLGNWEKLDELPFDNSRRKASVLVKHGAASFLLVKGSVEDMLSCCSSAYYRGRLLPMDAEGRKSVHAIVDELLSDGMQVLAVAVRELHENRLHHGDEQQLTLLGYLAFFDAPKQSAASAVQKLNRLHVATKVLTGDHMDVAVSVCRRLGMQVQKTMTGAELDALSDNDAQVRIEETAIFAALSPAQKARIVEVLQSNGHTVGFLADGMNDLPAVLQSDVGISVDTAVPSVKECADVILLKKDLNVLESGITEGRRAFANMSKYVKITASSNLGNILAIVFASVFLPFFPMTSVQLLLLNLLYDILCLALPWDRVDEKMIQRPLEWSGKKLSRFMLIFGPVSSLFDLITFFFLYGWLCPAVCGGSFAALSGAAREAFISLFQTGWFLESMWTQLLILHLLRTEKLPFGEGRPSWPVLAVTLFGIGCCTLLPFTPLGPLMGMTGLPGVYFLFLLFNVLTYLLVITLVKRLYIRHHRNLI